QRGERPVNGTNARSRGILDDPGAAGNCDSERAQTLAGYLDQLGVDSKVVTSAAAFANELKRGGYNAYWVSGGGTKLPQPLPTQLGAGVRLGESLMADGMQDLRESDRALQDLLGVYSSGKLADGAPATLTPFGRLAPDAPLGVAGEKLLVDVFDGATIESSFGVPAAAGATGATGHCIGSGNGHDRDGDGVDDDGHGACAAAPPTAAAVVSHQVGPGRTLFFGFDMGRSIVQAPGDAGLRAMGRSSFDWLAGAPQTDAPAQVGGELVARQLVLRNGPLAQTVSVVAELPRGASAATAGAGGTLVEQGGAASLRWQLTLAASETRALPLQWKLPLGSGSHVLRYTVSAASGAKSTLLAGDSVAFEVSGVADLAAAAQAAVAAVDAAPGAESSARNDAAQWMARALKSSQAGAQARALSELAMAQARLDKAASGALNDAQQALARMIRAVERGQ
ncbi:MAG TPA: hypothetical protein VFT05_01605, partial [Burkholderiaceae bacterium]|nr:hypothetical protein [Burkholderiaceae bacterium]